MIPFKRLFYIISIGISLSACQSRSDKQQNNTAADHNNLALIIYGGDGSVNSYDPEAKKMNWTYKNPGEIENRDNTFTIADDIIYVPFSRGNVTALNARNGTVKWSKQLVSAQDLMHSNPKFEDTSYSINGQSAVVNKDRIFLSARNSKLYALQKNDGKVLWEAPLKGPYTNYPPLFIGDFLYTNNETFLYKFNAHDGKLVWHTEFKSHPLNAKPVSDGKLIYTSDGIKDLYATDQDSKLTWKFVNPSIDGLSYDHLIAAEGTVYLVGANLKTNASTIVAVNSAKGSKKWESVFENQTIIYLNHLGAKIYAYTDEVFFVLDAKTGVQEFSERFPSFEQPGQEKAISNIIQKDPGTVLYLGNNGLVTFNLITKQFAVDYGIRAPESHFPRNVTWIEILPAK